MLHSVAAVRCTWPLYILSKTLQAGHVDQLVLYFNLPVALEHVHFCVLTLTMPFRQRVCHGTGSAERLDLIASFTAGISIGCMVIRQLVLQWPLQGGWHALLHLDSGNLLFLRMQDSMCACYAMLAMFVSVVCRPQGLVKPMPCRV